MLVSVLCGASAQISDTQITGVVRDSTGAAVPGAEVTVLVAGRTETLFTSREGQFNLQLSPTQSVSIAVRASGLEPVERVWEPGDTLPIEIVLRPATLLERVTVTATRTTERVSDTAASVSVLARDSLDSTAALPLDAKLREVPGFVLFRRTDSRTANPTTQGVSLRGVGASGASRAAVVSDGVPLNDPFGGWVYWDRVPPADIESVEILQGGASDLYGTGALGGVINIVPRRPQTSALSFETSLGNQLTVDSSFAGTMRIGNWLASASGGLFRTDGYISVREADRGTVDTQANSKHAVGAVRVERIVSEHFRTSVSGSILQESRQNGTYLQTNCTRLRNLAAGADWNSNAVGALALRFYGGPQTYDQSFSSIAADRNSETLTRLQRVPAQQVGGSAQWSRALGSRQTLVAGGEGREVRGASDEVGYASGSPTALIGAGGRQRNAGFFVESITRPTDRWMIQAGLRFDFWRNENGYLNAVALSGIGSPQSVQYTDRSEHAWSPRVSGHRKLNEKVSLNASMYRAFRAPTLNELYRSFRVGNVVTQSNPALEAERLTGGEAGISASTSSRRLTGQAALFWADVSSPIANVTLSVLPNLITRQRQNLGSTRSRGVEIEIEGRMSPAFLLSGAYQFADARVLRFPADMTLEGLWIPHVPRHVLTFQARYASVRRFTAALQGRMVSMEFDDDQNQLPLKGFSEVNATVARSLRPGVEVFAAVENLLDVRYEVGRTPVTTIGPPIMFRAGIRISTR